MDQVVTKDTSNATWKFDFADTVQADPQAKGGCLAVIRAYLNFASKNDPNAFCALPELMLRTGLSKPAIRRAKETLTRLGYMKAQYTTEGGAVMYRLVNGRKQLIDDHLRIARESLLLEQRDRKRRERKRSGGKETIPPQIDLRERNVTPAGNETLPNTVDQYRRDSCSEGREESPWGMSVERNPYAAASDDDPTRPFDIPENDNEAADILSHVNTTNPAILNALRKMLMAGELSPAFLTSNFGGGNGAA
ncbi:hypothetical protein DTW90_18560 [Neorhizobium sp. P12A]|uniref:hypothetical protein n=1 Tax=Neorhizobium sp. P12A TaxID=2268027 RepID=UPI0011EE3B43|nr:hypothetical protein [Neorhizobium sp. P12A]KAA0697433.1 hypothetical protein DTW90_18560 [Neorhizobium sp. P12A]